MVERRILALGCFLLSNRVTNFLPHALFQRDIDPTYRWSEPSVGVKYKLRAGDWKKDGYAIGLRCHPGHRENVGV
jgi:hypothetical protein